MPETCPVCGEETCTHTNEEKTIVKLQVSVRMLENSIEGWERSDREKERRITDLQAQLSANKCADCGDEFGEVARLREQLEATRAHAADCTLEATRAHLADMRRVAFSVIDAEELRAS